jgi:hypothetical protein
MAHPHLHLRPAHPLSELDASRTLPEVRIGHTEEARVQLILLFLGGALVLLAIGLIIGVLS